MHQASIGLLAKELIKRRFKFEAASCRRFNVKWRRVVLSLQRGAASRRAVAPT